MEQQRDALAALGDGHIEIAQKSYDQRYRIEVEWEPIRSKLTGMELAAELESSIEPLRQEVANTEAGSRSCWHDAARSFQCRRGERSGEDHGAGREAPTRARAPATRQPATRPSSSEPRTGCASCAQSGSD